MQRYIGYDLEENDNGACYLVEEVDKVIAEKDKEIERLQYLHSQHKSAMAEMAKANAERDDEITRLKWYHDVVSIIKE